MIRDALAYTALVILTACFLLLIWTALTSLRIAIARWALDRGLRRWTLPAAGMRQVCGWCFRQLRAGPGPTSYGICASCAHTHFPEVAA